MKLIPLPAFQDNDAWVSHDGRRVLADPGDAQPVLACLQRDRLQLGAILVTHHRPGQSGGPDALGSVDLIHYSRGCDRQRARDLACVSGAPGRIDSFLRARASAAAQAAPAHASAAPPPDVAGRATTRPWNNEFK
jgi:hypothetical protein